MNPFNFSPVLLVFCSIIFGIFTSISEAIEPESFVKLSSNDITQWDVRSEEAKWWNIEDETIVGGSLQDKVPYNSFIATKESYKNFELKLKIRIQGTEGFVNSGVQIRSTRVENNSEMKGYQVDAGDGWWGKLYDESRRNKVISEAKDLPSVTKSIRSQDWNDYRIIANGTRIQTWINDIPAIDFTELDASIPLDGKIGFQVHGGGKTLVHFKDIEIRLLPETVSAKE